jgi:hypothetical protein
MDSTETRYHLAYGRHSLILECCIQFYVTEWWPFFTTKWRDTAYNKIIDDSKYNYVPCPVCFFTKKMVKIRDCWIECGRECWEEFKKGAI